MAPLKTAVIGVGYFGRLHAEKHASASAAQLVAVVDADRARAEEVAAACGTTALTDYRPLLGKVDAVSVTVPTAAHFDVARDFLEAGAHVLVEKPIAETPAQARDLIDIAARRDRLLQVGHLERFSAARFGLQDILGEPMFIECHRIAPFKIRGTDVNVILDMMIHDIDIVLDIVRQPIAEIQALGVPVISDEEDIANARIRFANGCVANITASRVSSKVERKLRLFQQDAYMRIDFLEKKMQIVRRTADAATGKPRLEAEERVLEEGDALMREVESFLDCAAHGTPPLVSGEDGLRALESAIEITKRLREWTATVRESQAGAAAGR